MKTTVHPPSPSFWTGFWNVFYRTFTMDYAPHRIPPPPDSRPGWEIDSENIASYWNAVDDGIWCAIGKIEKENPSISKGYYEKRLLEAPQ